MRNERELANTRKKLHLLEELWAAGKNETDSDPELREAELESLQRLINQLKEEIARYEARHIARR
ncbi:MAG: hypothetical protein AB1716_09920 [Planctomycetota bacterium]